MDAKLLKQTKFPPDFNKKVDMTKVNIEVMKKWIAEKISGILGNEDDVVIELCFNLLEGSRFPNIKQLQIQLTGFLDKDTPNFCKELWSLCLSGQSSPQGVPKELLEAKKLELMQEKLGAAKAAEEAERRRQEEEARERELEQVRQRERENRGRGNRNYGPPSRGTDWRDARNSRSPPRRRRSPFGHRDTPPRRRADTYVPGGGGRSYHRDDRGRRPSRSSSSLASRSPSRSVSPPRRDRRGGARSPDRRRRRSPSSSRSPYRRNRGQKRARLSPDYSRIDRDNSRSVSRRATPRSRSPRKRRASPSASRSPAPLRRNVKGSATSRSRSRSRSRSSGSESDRDRRRRRRSPYQARVKRSEPSADVTKVRSSRDNHRLSRSRSRGRNRRRDRSTSSSTSRSPPPRSQSRSLSARNDRKRYQSIERYAPVGRRQHIASSEPSPEQKRHKKADSENEAPRSPNPPSQDESMKDIDDSASPVAREERKSQASTKSPAARLASTEFREKLLKEKLKASRRATVEMAARSETQ
ncbi:hypothetical protein FQN57_000997 [Myotisia sp. PD_48]|nr:hypothetical protein FQN57_000997 [Myotisia sp. PD_48]